MIEFIMMIRAVTDITERKRVEEELRAASDDMVLRANNLPGGNHEKKEQECQDG